MRQSSTAEPTTARLAKRAEELRTQHGVSVAHFALALGVHRSTAYAKLDGTRAWDSDEIAAAARLFGVSADELLGLEATK